MLLSAFYTVFPLVVSSLTGDLSATTSYLTVAFLAVIPPQLLVSYYADLYGRLQALVGISCAIGVALLILTFNSAAPVLWTAGLVYAGLIFCVYGLGVGDVNDRVRSELRGAAATALLAAYALGGIVGPLVTGWIYSELGSTGYFISAACVVASLVVAGLIALHGRRLPALTGD